ncbi:MAG: deoxynucleoside kinase [Acidobacteriota bacterium]|jgi:deoxyadenosine/deoxycytidine kinase|nr:deoxynucleoside kinase [Acidobacteriota bacterium]
MADYRYIAVDGLVRSGKTELARRMAEAMDARLILDSQENPYRAQFFSDLGRGENESYLKTQLIFLLNRYEQQMQIRQKGLFQKTTISDYIFFRDGIYAHQLLGDEELDLYKKIFHLFSDQVCQPDLVIYLQISFAEMMRRIREAGSEPEKSVPREYWRELFEAYNYFFFNYKNAPLLVVNMEKMDIRDQGVLDGLMREIRTHRLGTRYYAPL